MHTADFHLADYSASLPLVTVPESLLLVTVSESLLLVGVILFAVGYVIAVLIVTRWLYRDATRHNRPRASLWAAVVGVSLLTGGFLGIVLLAVYLRGREPRPTVTSES